MMEAPRTRIEASLIQINVSRGRGEASINDDRKIFGFLDPLPPCPHLELISTTNSHNLPYYIHFSVTPLPPLMPTSYLEAP